MGFLHWSEWVEFCKTSLHTKESKGQLDWVKDGFVDLKGRHVLKTKSGRWKASLFIIGVEFSEILMYYGIASNLIIYLTMNMHVGIETSTKDVNYWVGVISAMPLVGSFIADAYSGRYWMILASSALYLTRLILLTLSIFLSALKPRKCVEVCNKATTGKHVFFFLALYLIAFDTGEHKPSLQAFGADQFNEEDKNEKIKKASFFNWWYFGLCSGTLLAVIVVVYVQDNKSWGIRNVISIVAMAIEIGLFLYGTPFYKNKIPGGSPISSILQVVAVVVRNSKKNHSFRPRPALTK